MHHLHVSRTDDLERPGFVSRSKELLVAIFRHDATFLIDVVTHNDWTDERLVRIAHKNWPEQKFFLKLHGALGLEAPLSSQDRRRLRNANMTTLIEVDGEVLIPATAGLTTAGNSTRVAIYGQSTLRTLNAYENAPDSLVQAFVSHPDFRGVRWPHRASFEFLFIVSPGGYSLAIKEAVTGRILALP